MARYLLAPFGGIGDIHPFSWLARLLSQHDHAVRILGAPVFGETVGAAGLELTSVGFEGDCTGPTREPAQCDTAEAASLLHRFCRTSDGSCKPPCADLPPTAL